MNIRISIISLLFIHLFFSSYADVAIEGQVERRIRVTNIKDFPDFEFFFMYDEYVYDMGYHAIDPRKVIIVQDSIYSTGDRFSSAYLQAISKNDIEAKTENELGGSAQTGNGSVQYLVDDIKILKIENGIIYYKVLKTTKGKYGENFLPFTEEIKNGPGFWLMLILPAACLLSLIAFFIFRGKSGRYAGNAAA